MKILRISKKDDINVVVTLDNEEKLFISYEVLVKNGLRKGDEISEEGFSELIKQNQLYFIKQRAVRYLARRMHSSNELRIKLKQKKYDHSLIDIVITELTEKRYLDDYQFASEFADENIKNKLWGRNKLKAELIKRGIDSSTVTRVLSEKLPQGNVLESALALADKKFAQLCRRIKDTNKLREKIMAYLFSKGYDYDTIKQAVDSVIRGDEDAGY